MVTGSQTSFSYNICMKTILGDTDSRNNPHTKDKELHVVSEWSPLTIWLTSALWLFVVALFVAINPAGIVTTKNAANSQKVIDGDTILVYYLCSYKIDSLLYMDTEKHMAKGTICSLRSNDQPSRGGTDCKQFLTVGRIVHTIMLHQPIQPWHTPTSDRSIRYFKCRGRIAWCLN